MQGEHLAASGWLENPYRRIALCHSMAFVGVQRTVPTPNTNFQMRCHRGQHGHLCTCDPPNLWNWGSLSRNVGSFRANCLFLCNYVHTMLCVRGGCSNLDVPNVIYIPISLVFNAQDHFHFEG